MADKITKALAKLSKQELAVVRGVVAKIVKNDLESLDIKKLRDSNQIFRVRKRNLRIIFQKIPGREAEILQIARRSEKTYRKY